MDVLLWLIDVVQELSLVVVGALEEALDDSG